MRAFVSTLAALGLAVCGTGAVQAAEVALANFAPGSAAAATATVAVDGGPVRSLAYASHARVTLEAGTHVLRFDVDGRAVAEASVTVDADDYAVVALAGPADGYVAHVYDDGALQAALGAVPRVVLGRHHLALGAAAASRVMMDYQCASTAGEASGATFVAAGDSAYVSLAADAAQDCAITFHHAAFDTLEAAALPLGAGERRHVFLIGDGGAAGYTIYNITSSRDGDGQIDFSGTPSGPGPTTAVASLLESSTFWVDNERGLEGVSLFEVPGTGTIYGTWFGFERDGRASWLALDGGAVYGAARRDVKVYEVSRLDGVTRIDRVGSGSLQYSDCNHAVLRLFLRGVELRTLNLERSRQVAFCVALDKYG